jgi:hypothetical protein
MIFTKLFLRLGWKTFARDKHSNLLQKLVNYTCKKFYNIEIRGNVIELFTVKIYE